MKTGISKKSVRGKIAEIVRRIVETFQPEKIILFGSHARGDAGPDSDVDLLVVMNFTGSKREKRIEIRIALHDIPGSFDIIVTTPRDAEERRSFVGTIEYPAFREGKVVYARG